MVSVLIVHEDAQVAQALAAAIKGTGSYEIVEILSQGVEARKHKGSAQIAVISLYLHDYDGFDLIDEFKKEGVVPIPALHGSEGGEIWQKILAHDLRDVLVGVQDGAEVAQVLNSALSHASSASGSGSPGGEEGAFLIAVSSARGGVGKSIFSVNLAIAMAQYDARVALIDYSMFAGDFFSMLDQVPRNTIVDAIGQGEVDESLLSSLMSPHPLGFSYLACPNNDFDFYSFDYESARALLRVARGLYDYIVVDTGVYDLPPTNAAVDEADLIFMLTNRDLARLLSMQRLIKNYRERGFEDNKIKVIVNNAEEGVEITEDEIEDVIEHPVTAYLPSIGLETTFSINSGKPLIQSKPDLPMVSVLSKLAEYSIQRWAN